MSDKKKNDGPCVSKITGKDLSEAIFPGRLPREELRILLKPGAHAAMLAHAKTTLEQEICGVMLGIPKKDAQGPFLLIEDIIEGQSAQGAEAKVTFTPEAWEHIFKEQEKRDPDLKMVGWYHTHPRFGIFLSRYDQFIHENFFAVEPWMVAYVVDPVQDEEGFFAWHKGKTKRVQRYWIGDQPRTSDGAEFEGRDIKDDHAPTEEDRRPPAGAPPSALGKAAGPVHPPAPPWHQDPYTLGLMSFVALLVVGYMGVSLLRGDPTGTRILNRQSDALLYQGAISRELTEIRRHMRLPPSRDPLIRELNELHERKLQELIRKANKNNPYLNPKGGSSGSSTSRPKDGKGSKGKDGKGKDGKGKDGKDKDGSDKGSSSSKDAEGPPRPGGGE